MKQNTAMCTTLADAFADLFDGGSIDIRTGAQPSDPNSASSGSLLCTINLPTPAFGAASSGVVSKSGTWNGTATGTGTAGWARIWNAAATKWIDVSVGESASELIIDDDAIVSGGFVNVTSFDYTVPNT